MYARILVPIDGSATAQRGLREAISMARTLRSQLLLLTVVDPYPMVGEVASAEVFEQTRQLLVQRGSKLLEDARQEVVQAGLPCETLLREVSVQRAADAIVEEVAEHRCDLIVMGTHGRRGWRRLAMGSDAETVARESPVPVLLVRATDADA